jgi:hypothetical protein
MRISDLQVLSWRFERGDRRALLTWSAAASINLPSDRCGRRGASLSHAQDGRRHCLAAHTSTSRNNSPSARWDQRVTPIFSSAGSGLSEPAGHRIRQLHALARAAQAADHLSAVARKDDRLRCYQRFRLRKVQFMVA